MQRARAQSTANLSIASCYILTSSLGKKPKLCKPSFLNCNTMIITASVLVLVVTNHRCTKSPAGTQGLGGGRDGSYCFTVSVLQDEELWGEMAMVDLYLTPLNCTLKNGSDCESGTRHTAQEMKMPAKTLAPHEHAWIPLVVPAPDAGGDGSNR